LEEVLVDVALIIIFQGKCAGMGAEEEAVLGLVELTLSTQRAIRIQSMPLATDL
jgi:hypothetical protein